MAICPVCEKEMRTTSGCSLKRLHAIGGEAVKRLKVGEEDRGFTPGSRCGDCGARYGYYHHLGCDLEDCPICGNQLISCDCRFTEFDVEEVL